MQHGLSVKMISYNQVRDMAHISYLSQRGTVKTIFIHHDTFTKLMSGELSRSPETDGPTLEQQELKDMVVREVGKRYEVWFESCKEELLRNACNAQSES